jgi:flagellar biosynthesis/type III secretory pathway protein FliH
MPDPLTRLRALLPEGLEKTDGYAEDTAYLTGGRHKISADAMRDELAAIAADALERADYPASAAYDEGFRTGAQKASIEAEAEIEKLKARVRELERERDRYKAIFNRVCDALPELPADLASDIEEMDSSREATDD